MMGRERFVSASEIGGCSYCAYQVYLRKKHGDDKRTLARFKKGDREHLKFNKRHRTKSVVGPILLLLMLLALYVANRVVL